MRLIFNRKTIIGSINIFERSVQVVNISGVIANNQRMIIERSQKCCGTCQYFDGEPGDGVQFCDERETETHENNYCGRWAKK